MLVLSNRPHFLWAYWCDNPRCMLKGWGGGGGAKKGGGGKGPEKGGGGGQNREEGEMAGKSREEGEIGAKMWGGGRK